MPGICKGCGARVTYSTRNFWWMNEDGTRHVCPPERAA